MPMTILRAALAVCLLALAGGLAWAAGFTPGQKDEIGALVHEYLIGHPEVIEEALNELKRRQEAAEAQAQTAAIVKHADAIFRSPSDLVAGNPKGKVAMVEFFDYNCAYCKRAFGDVMKMIKTDGDLKLVMKEFPILGPGSVFASRAALASRRQDKYWPFHLAMLGHQGKIDEAATLDIAKSVGLDADRLRKDMEMPEINDVIAANMKLAEELNIQGTPAFIIDRTLIPGAIGYDGLTAAVRDVRATGGCQVC